MQQILFARRGAYNNSAGSGVILEGQQYTFLKKMTVCLNTNHQGSVWMHQLMHAELQVFLKL
jgi:hypothetical protein